MHFKEQLYIMALLFIKVRFKVSLKIRKSLISELKPDIIPDYVVKHPFFPTFYKLESGSSSSFKCQCAPHFKSRVHIKT